MRHRTPSSVLSGFIAGSDSRTRVAWPRVYAAADINVRTSARDIDSAFNSKNRRTKPCGDERSRSVPHRASRDLLTLSSRGKKPSLQTDSFRLLERVAQDLSRTLLAVCVTTNNTASEHLVFHQTLLLVIARRRRFQPTQVSTSSSQVSFRSNGNPLDREAHHLRSVD